MTLVERKSPKGNLGELAYWDIKSQNCFCVSSVIPGSLNNNVPLLPYLYQFGFAFVKIFIMDLGNQEILFTRQRHEADRAGLHWDYRIVIGDKAYSWATKKELPEEGKSIILHEQPVHDATYALSKRVEIPKGQYGAGVTTLDWVVKGNVESKDDHHVISTKDGRRFLLKKMESYGPKQWLFIHLPKMKKEVMEKSALTRLVKELAKGTVSKKITDLSSLGFIKPKAVYEKGMKIGNINIAKKEGVVFSKGKKTADSIMARAGGGYATLPIDNSDKVKVISKGLPIPGLSLKGPEHQGAIRHELFEARELKRSIMNKSNTGVSLKNSTREYHKTPRTIDPYLKYHLIRGLPRTPLPSMPKSLSNPEKPSSHLSQKVLLRESEMIRKNPYLEKIKQTRKSSGESEALEKVLSKRYGVDKVGAKDFKKIDVLEKTSGVPISKDNLHLVAKSVVNRAVSFSKKSLSGKVSSKEFMKFLGSNKRLNKNLPDSLKTQFEKHQLDIGKKLNHDK